MYGLRIGEIPMRGRERRLKSRLNIFKSVPYFASRAIALFFIVQGKRIARFFGWKRATQPICIIVTGPPGSGKSTLASRLQAKFGLPLITKDHFKELMFDKLGPPADMDKAKQYGKLSFALMQSIMTQVLENNNNIIIEGNFSDEEFGEELRVLKSRLSFLTFQIHLHATPETLQKRFAGRTQNGQRHSGHSPSFETESDKHLREIDWECAPLNLKGVNVSYDTTDLSTLSYAPLFAKLEGLLPGEGTDA